MSPQEKTQSDVEGQKNPGLASDERLHFPDVQAAGDWSHEVPERLQLDKEGPLCDPPPLLFSPDSHSVVVEPPVVEPKEKTLDDMSVSSEEESTDLPFVAERSKRPNKGKLIGRHKVFEHFPKNPKCAISKLTKTARAPCKTARKHEETVLIIRRNLVMRKRRIAKVSMMRKNLVCSIVTHSRGYRVVF